MSYYTVDITAYVNALTPAVSVAGKVPLIAMMEACAALPTVSTASQEFDEACYDAIQVYYPGTNELAPSWTLLKDASEYAVNLAKARWSTNANTKVLVMPIGQAAVADPSLGVALVNTIGAISTGYDNIGLYNIISAGLFTVGKTEAEILNRGAFGVDYFCEVLDVNTIQISTAKLSADSTVPGVNDVVGTLTNGLLSEATTQLKIIVYP